MIAGAGSGTDPAMTRVPEKIPIVTSIADVGGACEAWICDVWGVMHNGMNAFPAAADACRRFREAGGTVLLLSNAPRPASAVESHLDRLGVPRTAYDAIVTSGDLTRRLVAEAAPRTVYHLGPARDAGIFAGLDVRFAPPDTADVVVCSGLLDDDTEQPEDYRPVLQALAARTVPMICANPDLTVERGARILHCAGGLATLYETLGGRVTYAGKPHAPVYALALDTIAALRRRSLDRGRVLAIGDGLRTDIAGAHAAGIPSLFIASAVHVREPLSPAVIDTLFGASEARPVAAMPALAW